MREIVHRLGRGFGLLHASLARLVRARPGVPLDRRPGPGAHARDKADEVPRGEWRTVTTDVRGTEATSGERFRTAEGLTVVIEGIQAPALDDDGTAVSFGGAKARARLDELIKTVPLTLEFEGDRRLPDGDYLAHAVARGRQAARRDPPRGRPRPALPRGGRDAPRGDRCSAAHARAKKAAEGRLGQARLPDPAGSPRSTAASASGSTRRTPTSTTPPFLDEIRDVGASHVLIPSPWLMEDWQSNDFGPVSRAGRPDGPRSNA